MADIDLKKLAAEFPQQNIHWRAQSLTRDKKKAQALAYLDARDVMDRLDEVCGPANWQSRYVETAKGRVLCEIGIKIDGEWVWKSDGAGNTAVEGEKGGISDSLKRAAVQWGIGRYLYRLSAPWVPCETNDRGQWRKWLGDPWKFVRSPGGYSPTLAPDADETTPPPEPDADAPRVVADRIKAAIEARRTLPDLRKLWDHDATAKALDGLPEPMRLEVTSAYSKRFDMLGGNNAQAPGEAA